VVGLQEVRLGLVANLSFADSWARAETRQPACPIPCFRRRRYGCVLDDDMLMALPPDQLDQRSSAWRPANNGFLTRSRNTAFSRTFAPHGVSYPDRNPPAPGGSKQGRTAKDAKVRKGTPRILNWPLLPLVVRSHSSAWRSVAVHISKRRDRTTREGVPGDSRFARQ